MSAVVASYGLGLLKPTGLSAYEPLPAPILTAFHVAFIGNDEVAAFAEVACTPSMFLTIVTVTSGRGPSHGPLTRSDVVSHGVKSTVVVTGEPDPGPTGPGPLALPHQLHSALRLVIAASVLPTPQTVL